MTSPETLRLERVVAARQEQVWEAWTTEGGLASWWWSHWRDTQYAVDLRLDGSYLIEAPSQGIGVTGEFRRIDKPHTLEMTWVWLEHGDRGEVEQVTVTFTPEDDPAFTRIEIVHTGPWTTPEPAENYATGWNFTLDQLEAMLAHPGSV
jgi:uncharacterized protein YndB with AHSA1/START domain